VPRVEAVPVNRVAIIFHSWSVGFRPNFTGTRGLGFVELVGFGCHDEIVSM